MRPSSVLLVLAVIVILSLIQVNYAQSDEQTQLENVTVNPPGFEAPDSSLLVETLPEQKSGEVNSETTKMYFEAQALTPAENVEPVVELLRNEISQAKQNATKQYSPRLVEETDTIMDITNAVKTRMNVENNELLENAKAAVLRYQTALLNHKANENLFTVEELEAIDSEILRFKYLTEISSIINSDSPESFVNLLENSVKVVKKGKDRKHKKILEREKERITHAGHLYNMETAETPIGTRALGADFLTPAKSCLELYEKGDDQPGPRWLHTSNHESNFFTRQIVCAKGWDLVGMSSKDNTRQFTFDTDINEGFLYKFNEAAGFSQIDLARYQTYTEFIMKIETETSSQLIRSKGCPISKAKDLCRASCPCQVSKDSKTWYTIPDSTDSVFPLSSVLVFVQPAAATIPLQ